MIFYCAGCARAVKNHYLNTTTQILHQSLAHNVRQALVRILAVQSTAETHSSNSREFTQLG
jgi:hypothetical protein